MPPEILTEPGSPPAAAADRSPTERWIELLLVLFVAVSQPLLLSLYIALFGIPNSITSGNLRYVYACAQEASGLLVLWYVLRRTGRTFSSLGLRASLRGGFAGLGLAVVGWAAYLLSGVLIEGVHRHYFGTYVTRTSSALLFPKASWMVLVPFLLLNCFFEEAIVRAYLMTEVSELTGSMSVAAVASVLVQTSYHTYQGWLPVIGLAATFSVFSFYYARTRELFPLYVAHVLVDTLAIAYLIAR